MIALRIAEVVDILVFRQLIGQGLHLQLTASHLQGQGQEFVTVGIVDGGEEEEVKDVLPTPVQILDLQVLDVQCVQVDQGQGPDHGQGHAQDQDQDVCREILMQLIHHILDQDLGHQIIDRLVVVDLRKEED